MVRYPDGSPADIEARSETVIMYLAQIRDRLVKPYIKNVGLFTGEDRREAVFAAYKSGYHYYISGDLDGTASDYTLLAYDRTANENEAVTNLIAVSAELTGYLEGHQIRADEKETWRDSSESIETSTEESSEDTSEETSAEESSEDMSEESTVEESSEVTSAETSTEESSEDASSESTVEESSEESAADTPEEPAAEGTAAEEPKDALNADALKISGAVYDLVSQTKINDETPWLLYCSKDKAAGNPVSMIYTESETESTRIFFGTWVSNYFSAKGVSNAYSYMRNEDLLTELREDKTIYTRVPVQMMVKKDPDNEDREIAEAVSLSLSFLTKKQGLPEGRIVLDGLTRSDTEPPPAEHPDEMQKHSGEVISSAFSGGMIGLIVSAVALTAGAVIGVIFTRKKRKERSR